MTVSSMKMGVLQPPAKQARLRTACNQCHAVKIRCSGEKTGCSRCRSANLACQYSVSMVGRTSKRNKRGRMDSFLSQQQQQQQQQQPHKRREIEQQHEQPQQDRQQHEDEEDEEEEEGGEEEYEEAGAEEQPQQRQRPRKQRQRQHQHQHQHQHQQKREQQQQPQINEGDFALSPNGSVPTWTGHFQSDPAAQGNMLSVDALNDQLLDYQAVNGTSSESFPADFDFDSLNAELNIDQFFIPNLVDQDPTPFILTAPSVSVPTSPKNYEITCPQAPASIVSKGNVPQHQLHSEQCSQKRQHPHVSALTRIIVLLETYIQSSATAIDELMHVTKACMADLTRIMELKEYAMGKSCGILVSTAMELAITLYETAVSEHKAMPTALDQQQRQLSPLSSSSSWALSRGESIPNLQFGIFQLDQEDQMAIRNRIISKQLNRSIEIIRSLGSDGSKGGKVHKPWYVEMEHRAKKLISSLEESYD